ncbi:MAG TPA: tRNA (adenosine(37)-N6)-threonylcarbamoyltransferase complex transferase subunit TsaD [Nitrospiraceae bacterium]|nr:tRNA (adenosine(37)-N6)-threonylcarbamoyltransferase complex transferase subunit TsaD [Nitrospiraceae bacterium]
MFTLGIDTSCDDTSASIVEDGHKIFSNVVSSQSEIHKKYGGIVPELASRRHIEMMWPVVDEAIKRAGVGIRDISAIAVCYGPGLIGSLLVGVSFAKAVAYAKGLRLVAVNHLEGHIFTAMLLEQRPEFPFLALLVSGGHTVLYRVDGFGIYRELGRTRDDAAGEAYDKVAKLLGLGYPGGPIIDRLSVKGDSTAIPFPRAYLPGSLDFSFSGLKTAVLNYLKKNPDSRKEDIAASFQAAVVDTLIEKTIDAAKMESMKRIALSGGVAANSALRASMKQRGSEEGIEVYLPLPALCTDNGAMIAAAGYHHFIAEKFASFDLNATAYLPL